MPSLPTFVVEAFERAVDGPERSLGHLDMTEDLLRLIWLGAGGRPSLPLRTPRPDQLADSLTAEARQAAYESKLSLPGFLPGAAAFVASIGGFEGAAALRSAYLARSRARSHRAEAERLLADVLAATQVEPVKDAYLFDPYADLFIPDLSEAYAQWSVASFTARNPMPMAFQGADFEAWERAREEYRASVAPPYLFATTGRPWEGIPAGTLREAAENERAGEGIPLEAGAIDLHSLIDNELEDHFEDARGHLVGEAGLSELVRSWTPHAGSGDAVDLAFDAALATWNARQSIVSHHTDRTRLVMVRPGATKDDAVRYCEADVEAAIRALAATEDGWNPPEPTSAAA